MTDTIQKTPLPVGHVRIQFELDNRTILKIHDAAEAFDVTFDDALRQLVRGGLENIERKLAKPEGQ